jgi:PAS domain S-box-containing protein
MISHPKTVEELLEELEELRRENDSLKVQYQNDTAERKHVEEELRKREEELNEAQRLGQIGSWDLDSATNSITRSKEYFRIYGLDPVLRPAGFEKHVANYSHESSELLDKAFWKCLRSGEGYQLNLEYIHPDGTSSWITERGEAKRDGKGQIVGLRGTAQDITKRKRAEKEIVMLAQSLRSINECVSITDTEDKILFVNESFIKTYGYEENELIGKQMSIVRSLNNPLESVGDILSATLQGEWKGELWNKRKDGSEFPIYLSSTIVNGMDGRPLGLIGVANDITERKKTEEEIKKTSKALEKLNLEKDKLFSIIAHDLRSPFHGLLGITKMMANENDAFTSTEIAKFSKEMHIAVENLYKLLENLLEWGQFQTGTIGFNPKELLLSQVFSQSIDTLMQRALQKGIDVQNEINENQIIYADERMINSVMGNLLTNAIKFTRRGGKIVGKARKRDDGMVEITVTDSGVGISANNLRKLFKLDEKVSTKGTENEPSTGLGLLLCKEFVEKNGGKIWVESEEGKGSTFSFSLPVRDSSLSF